MSGNFSPEDSPERLVAGLGVFLNPECVLSQGQQLSIFTREESDQLQQLPKELLLKMASSAERRHDAAISFVNMLEG